MTNKSLLWRFAEVTCDHSYIIEKEYSEAKPSQLQPSRKPSHYTKLLYWNATPFVKYLQAHRKRLGSTGAVHTYYVLLQCICPCRLQSSSPLLRLHVYTHCLRHGHEHLRNTLFSGCASALCWVWGASVEAIPIRAECRVNRNKQANTNNEWQLPAFFDLQMPNSSGHLQQQAAYEDEVGNHRDEARTAITEQPYLKILDFFQAPIDVCSDDVYSPCGSRRAIESDPHSVICLRPCNEAACG